ncbi:dihydropyrimidine dehydrogenase [Halobiforma lacisalsi AJ5]|uniref:Dihydropyrimidine dehydrogenase n=1 Tax=Natronobacterium lacisalsi AJ5 TaxID=358396 RepID=M0LFV2_NATLA|nr:tRNA-dihydrouridine synthase [Halobiforma lacisalsi]APW98601.1 dihydropyrimidine dehydrogenase [Halobiforma lacisalsi AJ5]EMA32462.1 dihydropyrimidine dehydrogenase [Halobiforma lacisalsi AJ5]
MFEPRLALASLSGAADADWARNGADYAGAAFLGGIAIDPESRAAARTLVQRDREEFLPEDPLAFVDRELAALEDVPLRPAFNVRSATVDPVADAARICREHDAFLEINAHCRQEELCAVGCGETLLRDADRLAEYVRTAADAGATVGVKVRAEVPGVDLPAVARAIDDAGASFVHVDAMDSEPVIADVSDAADLFVIANNEVRDDASVREYVEYGADAVSVGRPSDNPVVLERVHDAVRRRLAVGTP